MRRGFVGLVLAVTVVAVAGCSGGERPAVRPSSSPSDGRGEALRAAVHDPVNVDVKAWAGLSADELADQAQQVCDDLRGEVPLSEVWSRQQDRVAGVSTFDADYFTQAAARLYCPARSHEAAG